MNIQNILFVFLVASVYSASCAKLPFYGGLDQGALNVCRKVRSENYGGVPMRVVPNLKEDTKEYRYQSGVKGKFAAHFMFPLASVARLAYFEIPKAGSTSIRKVMARDLQIPWVIHKGVPAEYHKKAGPGSVIVDREKRFTFTFIADPVSHFVGGWIQVCGPAQSSHTINGFIRYTHSLVFPQNATYHSRYGYKGCASCNEHHWPLTRVLKEAKRPDGSLIDFHFVGRLTKEHVRNDWNLLREAIKKYGKENKMDDLANIQLGGLPKSRSNYFINIKTAAHELLHTRPKLMRMVCFLRWQDFTCLNFDFPKECVDENGEFNVFEFGTPPLY